LINHLVGLSPLWQYLVAGDFLGFIQAVYTSVLGLYFYGMLILIIFSPIFLKTRSAVYLMIIWLVSGFALIGSLPAGFYQIGAIILYLSGGGALYYLFRNMRD